MNNRYLFREGVLIATAKNSYEIFDELSMKGDLMLSSIPSLPVLGQLNWQAYRMTQYDNLSWGWFPLPKEDTDQLRTLLLLQQ